MRVYIDFMPLAIDFSLIRSIFTSFFPLPLIQMHVLDYINPFPASFIFHFENAYIILVCMYKSACVGIFEKPHLKHSIPCIRFWENPFIKKKSLCVKSKSSDFSRCDHLILMKWRDKMKHDIKRKAADSIAPYVFIQNFPTKRIHAPISLPQFHDELELCTYVHK